MTDRSEDHRPAKSSPAVEQTGAAELERTIHAPWISDELDEHTIRVWSKQYGRQISVAEAVEICVNVTRVAECLAETGRVNNSGST